MSQKLHTIFMGILGVFALVVTFTGYEALCSNSAHADGSRLTVQQALEYKLRGDAIPATAMDLTDDDATNAPATNAMTVAAAAESASAAQLSDDKLAQPRIVVKKSKQMLYLYDGDKLVKNYKVLVGKKPGAKKTRGDMRTPEGNFYVCVRNDKSNYYRALGLSYPTPADAARGLKTNLIKKADYQQILAAHQNHDQPTWTTRLGGSIMIHGIAPGRTDTNGCVAFLDNRQMQELFDRIPLRTPVHIEN